MRAIAVIILIVAFAQYIFTPSIITAYATHWSGTLHQRLIHRGVTSIGWPSPQDDEHWCAESRTYYMSADVFGNIVKRAVLYTTPRQWNDAPNGIIEYYKVLRPCGDYRNRNWIEIEFHLTKTNADLPWRPCNENLSCVAHYGPISEVGFSHIHYKWEWVFIDYDNITGPQIRANRTINHELGHVYGLLDGDGTCRPRSLMHNIWYGCSYNDDAPTRYDLQSAWNVSQYP